MIIKNKKYPILILLLLCAIFSVNAQQEEDAKVKIKGVLLDEESHEPIPFANIGLLGTHAGVATDMDGYFELAIPYKYAVYTVRISAIGYAPVDFKFYDLQERSDQHIFLKPVSYSLKNVVVEGEWRVFKGLFDKAVASIPQNYIPRPYNYEGYFEYGVRVNDGEKRSKEAVVTIYDAEGYKRSSVKEAFHAINYNFIQIRRSHEPESIREGMIYLDDLLSADIVRHTRNVLDTKNYDSFKFRDLGKFIYEGDSVQVVGYETNNPTLTTTGSVDANSYSGEIYIAIKNGAVIKNTIKITSNNFNIMGRSLLPIDEPIRSGVTINITTNYKKISSYYFLSGISMVYSYEEDGNNISGELQYQTTRVYISNVTPFEGRIYYESMDPDYNFWDNYMITLEEEN